MASSAHMLLYSAIKFKDGYEKAGQMDMMYDMIKWPLDYFLKAWNEGAQELVVQVKTNGRRWTLLKKYPFAQLGHIDDLMISKNYLINS